jgi:alpha-L-fucosidase
LEQYGHPSKFGFKDVINEWKAENWNPEELVTFYKNSGAKYFMAMANHHDNLDLYKSKYQEWNSVKVGPKKDIIGGWEKAARKNGMHFGVSVHAAHAWSWYETSQKSDKTGAFAGIPYDGKLTKKDGKGTWWEGLDPQELYEQNHPLSQGSDNVNNAHKQWDWGEGVAVPNSKYCNKFLNRTLDLINKYNPDLIYFDDTALPLWPISDVGLKIAAHLYNKSIKENKTQEAVIFGKILDKEQRKCMVWDIERGQSNKIEPLPWQTDTCLGNWHYQRSIFEERKYKSAKTVVHTLVDVVSKNGNLCLNVPVRGDGTIDEEERNIVSEIGRWMEKNSEAIYDTRPWKIFGEGPALENTAPLSAQGFNEGKSKPFTASDYRFTTKGNVLYVVGLGWPDNGKALIKSLSLGNVLRTESINRIEFLGGDELKFSRNEAGLEVILPDNMPELNYAYGLKIS